MSSYEELVKQRTFLEFQIYCARAEGELDVEAIDAFFKELPIGHAREHINRILDKDRTAPALGVQCRKNLLNWLSDNPEELVHVPIGASCNCGAVHFAVDAAPTELDRCGCATCWRYGALWAYYDEQDVSFAVDNGETESYIGMCNGRTLTFNRCRRCGCVTHWRAMDGREPRMGVNALMMEPDAIEDALLAAQR
ncbi:GFA family protein [Paraburkholderia sp. MM5477-R1]|uniref:GFA family protein n=1 Tax=Paraburkholderia sp. MM5477-R1 TaxID=2991062 RepID=UPI003D20399D